MSLFTIKIFKSWLGRDPSRRWSNTYELESTALSPAGVLEAAEAIADAEKLIHYDAVHFLSAIASTWEPDGTPYNPLSFTTLTLSGTGARGNSLTEQTLDKNVCYQVNFVPELGRSGRRFYRGALSEVDVEPGGDLRFTIKAASIMADGGSQFELFRAAIDPYIATGGVGDTIVMVGEGGSGVLSREVVSVGVGGVVVNKSNHRYFDRA